MANFALFKMPSNEAVTISSVVEKGFFQDGSVGRLVASKTRGPRFESHHRKIYILNI